LPGGLNKEHALREGSLLVVTLVQRHSHHECDLDPKESASPSMPDMHPLALLIVGPPDLRD
jgi:hypothetical protein